MTPSCRSAPCRARGARAGLARWRCASVALCAGAGLAAAAEAEPARQRRLRRTRRQDLPSRHRVHRHRHVPGRHGRHAPLQRGSRAPRRRRGLCVGHWLKIGVGGKLDDIHYGPGQVVTWTQNAESWGRATITPIAPLSFTLKIGNGLRKASSFDAAALPPEENPLIREYDYAPRDRVFSTLTGAWTATSTLTWSMEGSIAKDDYRSSPLGLQSVHEYRGSTTLTWTPRDTLSAYIDGGYERLFNLQNGYAGVDTHTVARRRRRTLLEFEGRRALGPPGALDTLPGLICWRPRTTIPTPPARSACNRHFRRTGPSSIPRGSISPTDGRPRCRSIFAIRARPTIPATGRSTASDLRPCRTCWRWEFSPIGTT